MEDPTTEQQNYEKKLVYHLCLFLKAMDQYRIWGRRAAASEALRGDPQFEQGMRRIMQALRICGECFRTLPQLLQGGESAEQLIRSIGQEIGLFAESLEKLIATADPVIQETMLETLSFKSIEIKQSCRQFAERYEEAFPGRLSLVLQSLQNGVAPEMQEVIVEI